MLRKILLSCGILSSMLFAMMVMVIRYEGYSLKDQTVSELAAIGVSTRSLWLALGTVYDLLLIAFGLGVWISAGEKRSLRVAGGLLIIYGALVVIWPFASMHQREVLAAGGETLSDTLHVILVGLEVPLMLAAIGFGAIAFGKRFRLYSIATIVMVVIFGILTGLDSSSMSANEPTPWIGVWERISIVGSLIWLSVLAIVLLRKSRYLSKSTRTRRVITGESGLIDWHAFR